MPPSCSKAGSAMRLEIWNYLISMAVFHSLSVLIHSNISKQECCLTVHLPGVLMESHSEVCLLVLRVQKEDRPVQVAISI